MTIDFSKIGKNKMTSYLELLALIESIQVEIAGSLVKSSKAQAGSFSYSYMKLDDLDPLVREACRARNLRLYYPAHGGYVGAGIISLSTGDREECLFPLKSEPKDIQDYGKYITYLKRYALFGVLGVYGATDDDGGYSQKPSKSQYNPDAKRQAPQQQSAPASLDNLW